MNGTPADHGHRAEPRRLPVTVDFSHESPHRSGWVEYETRGDTVVIRQSLERSEQWESDAVYTVFIPRSILRSIAAGMGRWTARMKQPNPGAWVEQSTLDELEQESKEAWDRAETTCIFSTTIDVADLYKLCAELQARRRADTDA